MAPSGKGRKPQAAQRRSRRNPPSKSSKSSQPPAKKQKTGRIHKPPPMLPAQTHSPSDAPVKSKSPASQPPSKQTKTKGTKPPPLPLAQKQPPSTTQPVASTDEYCCGFCGLTCDPPSKTLDQETDYVKTCRVCNEVRALHYKCAINSYAIITGRGIRKGNTLTAKAFRSCSGTFYCTLCKDNCFLCSATIDHGGKLLFINSFNFIDYFYRIITNISCYCSLRKY